PSGTTGRRRSGGPRASARANAWSAPPGAGHPSTEVLLGVARWHTTYGRSAARVGLEIDRLPASVATPARGTESRGSLPHAEGPEYAVQHVVRRHDADQVVEGAHCRAQVRGRSRRVHPALPRPPERLELPERSLQRHPMPRARHDRLHVAQLEQPPERHLRKPALQEVESFPRHRRHSQAVGRASAPGKIDLGLDDHDGPATLSQELSSRRIVPRPTPALRSDDFPALGRPAMTSSAPSRNRSPSAAVRSNTASRSRTARHAPATRSGLTGPSSSSGKSIS